MKHCEFSSRNKGGVQNEQDVENLSRTIIAYALKNYHGDEIKKQFIIDKTESVENKKTEEEKQSKTEEEPPVENQNIADLEWAKNAEELLGDENYKKHLIRQANRILLRLRQLFYIKHEIIGDENAVKIDEDDNNAEESSSNPIPDLQIPEVLQDLPAEWWDRSCDVSMFVGVYKHGYEKYSLMRLDPKLCFLQICGPPDAQDLLAEQQQQQQQDEANFENNDVAFDDRRYNSRCDTGC